MNKSINSLFSRFDIHFCEYKAQVVKVVHLDVMCNEFKNVGHDLPRRL